MLKIAEGKDSRGIVLGGEGTKQEKKTLITT